MDKKDKKSLENEIKEVNSLNFEQNLTMFKYFINTFLYSLIVYGYNDSITKETIEIWKKFRLIMKEEKDLYNFLLSNSERINIGSAYNFIDELDFLNEQTVNYFIDALDDIEDSCEMKVRWRAEHRKKNFDTLIDTDDYKLQAYGMTISLEDIKEFLNYSEDFWKYVKEKTMFVDSKLEKNQGLYSVLMRFDDDNKLIDMRVIIPYIVDLFTALVNVHELKHAYDLYQLLGQEINNEEEFENSAREKENEFIKIYVRTRLN